MARSPREVRAGLVYHVLNRGNGRQTIFREDADYAAFLRVLAEAFERYPVDLLSYCLMGNHWHLVVSPRRDDALADLMRWIGVTHVRRHHEHYHTRGGGHLYQGRFKSFPVQSDVHFLILCRYVEQNGRRAKLVRRAEGWPWGAAYARNLAEPPLALADWPVKRPKDWLDELNRSLPPKVVDDLRISVNRGRPWGDAEWVKRTAAKLGLESTLRGVGRPRKAQADRGYE
jgi:putative transposase